jgi:hypothetical protein
MMRDPQHADLAAIASVAAEPQRQAEVDWVEWLVKEDRILVGGFVTPVDRDVAAETTVDGYQQIVVRQCDEDDPDSKVYQGGVEVDVGSPRVLYEYVVRWIEEEAGWRVVNQRSVSDSC